MQSLLTALRAVGESTRLRLLALCSRAELSVSDLTQILAQSQPGISRHLRLLCEAGLLERSREGTWAFYRLARSGRNFDLARALAALSHRGPDAWSIATLEGATLRTHSGEGRASVSI